jgi:hypothetical protein
LNNTFTVFGIRDLEDEVRPVAMYVILDYIWTHIRRNRKKRLLVIDEAWFLMQHPDSARFLFSLAKRARKYYLGLTTITQDVEDFVATDMGKAIITNSSLQFLMKQSPSSVDKLQEVFYLSAGEKNLLLSSNVGEGLFFAGSAHVALQVIASPQEHRLITTDPRELDALANLSSEEEEKINTLLAGESEEGTQAAEQPLENGQAIDVQSPPNEAASLPTAAPELPIQPNSETPDDELFITAKSDSRIGSPELPLPQPQKQATQVNDAGQQPPTPLAETRVPHQIPQAPVMDTERYDSQEEQPITPEMEPENASSANEAKPSPITTNTVDQNGYIDVFAGSGQPAPSNSTPSPSSNSSANRQSLNLVPRN